MGREVRGGRFDPGDLEGNLRVMKIYARMAREDPMYWVWFNEFINKALEIIRKAHEDERVRRTYLEIVRRRD